MILLNPAVVKLSWPGVPNCGLQGGNNSAEFGQFTGAVVNAVTKSGTNHP
jgi:hypothetical protein